MVHERPASQGGGTAENDSFCWAGGQPTSPAERTSDAAARARPHAGSTSIFEEAARSAARLLGVPVCIVGAVDPVSQWRRIAVGLAPGISIGDFADLGQPTSQDILSAHVVARCQALNVGDIGSHRAFAHSLLARQHGIRAYLGVPLLTASGSCVGALEALDQSPRQFSDREVELLTLVARWCMSELDRDRLLKELPLCSPLLTVRTQLLSHMSEELRTPLTAILGMTSVLQRGIYGSLTEKQREYVGIVHSSSKDLLTLVNSMLELGSLREDCHPSPVDVEMLCQQALQPLEQVALCRNQQLRVTIEPRSRHWLLDKDKVRQMLYHLVFSILQSADADSLIRVHACRRQHQLQLIVWTSHAWLGEGLLSTPTAIAAPAIATAGAVAELHPPSLPAGTTADAPTSQASRQSLGIMLSSQLAALHGGRLLLQGSAEIGYRYVISLPPAWEGLVSTAPNVNG